MELSQHEQWARFRFSVVGHLLASPPALGELQDELLRLSEMTWQHPITGEPVRFAVPTIERWYYTARNDNDPVVALRRKPRRDRGRQRAISVKLGEALRKQHGEHPCWSYQLHFDNMAARIEEEPDLGPLPSYASVRRYMISNGLKKRRRKKGRKLRDGERRAREHHESREQRSFEAEYVSGLWHLDFHHSSCKILTAKAEWARPILLAILDDHSRLICHAQWYWQETAESLVHGLIQAFCKRGLPRALMTDNGGAMVASETTQGLQRLSIQHQTTLPYSPHQNGKQEVFFAQVEGRLLAMLDGEPELTLPLLNTATSAWYEMGYHRSVHSETGQKPLDRWLEHKSVSRDCPSVDDLRLAFTVGQVRTQRSSDGTISVAGTRFEVPARYSHLQKLRIRYASWDLGHVWLMDEAAGIALERLYPLDKVRNAEGHRRSIDPQPRVADPPASGIAPLLRRMMAEYAATGIPPAYIPKGESS
jgi:transposase InsO family protein